MPKRSIWLSAGTLALACATPRAASPGLLVARASFDLGCPPAALAIYAFDARTRAVVGCGQRATYVEDCRAPGRPCTWVADVGPAPFVSPEAVAQPVPATQAVPKASTQWPASTPGPAVPAATVTAEPQPLPGNHAFRGEEDYGF
jgi:hypothetical protein